MASGINLSDNDLFNTIRKIDNKKGALIYDRVPGGAANATATGTAAARISIVTTAYQVPDLAVELLAVAPGLATTAAAAADTSFGYMDISGQNWKFGPTQMLAPIGSVDLSVGAVRFTPQEFWTLRAPVTAGTYYDWGYTSLVANAHNGKAWVDVVYSTIPSGDPLIYSQVSAITAFKAAGSQSTGSLILSAANSMYELASGYAPEAAAVAQENQILSTSANCTSLLPLQTQTYGQDPPAQIAATSGDTQLNQISRVLTVGSSFKISSPTINYTTTLDVATSNNITAAHCVRYTSF